MDPTNMADAPQSVALARARELLVESAVAVVDGYLDVLGDDQVPRTPAQRLMGSTLLPRIYERLWRPVVFFGFTLRSSADEDRLRLRLMDISPGDTVLDIACGPGNTARRLIDEVGDGGLVVGVDSAATMLAQAVRDTSPNDPVAYVRADGSDLPFSDELFDAVSCYGALYLMDDPFATLHEMVRVLKPGGRLALLTTCARGPSPLRRFSVAASQMAPVRLFDVHEITMALRAAGMEDVERTVSAGSQTVNARKRAS